MHENEPAHWFDDAAMAKAVARLFFQAGRRRSRYRALAAVPAGDVFPGVAIPSGHTPGHTTFMIAGVEQLLIKGDTVHVPEVQTAQVCMEVDTDQEAAAVHRKVFDMVATDRLLVTGMHLHFPGFAAGARGHRLSADPGR